MWASVLKIVGASILTIAIVWGLVLGWWQANDYQPTRLELLLYLGALPLALIGGFLLLKGFIDHIKNPPQPEPQSTEAIDNDPLASAAAKSAAMERGYSIALQWVTVVAAPGTTGSEIIDSVVAGKRPEPDPELLDHSGFPVFAARVPLLDDGHLAEWLNAHQDSLPKAFLEGESARALALLDQVLPAALQEIQNRFENKDHADARLRIQWLVPMAWEHDHHPALLAWLRSTYLNDLEKSRYETTIRPIETDVQALMEVDELILAIKREQLEKDVHLVLGANSLIGEKTIHALAARNHLFTPDQQGGQIPGECAVCLLFTGTPEDTGIIMDEAVRVSRINSAPRDKAVDAGGRVNSALLEQLIDGAMTIRGIDSADVKKVIADCDHRDSRITELMTAVAQRFNDLEPMGDCHSIGLACGSTPPLGGLLALACSRDKALAEEGSIVCLSNQDAFARAALVVEPFPILSGSEDAGTPTS